MFRNLFILKHIVLTILIFCNFIVQSQTVGLVLSGGGAKGFTHIGVIKALEENNIPIDYIAGTSAGAIIGGLYASGFTTDEMYTYVTSDEFIRASKGDVDEKYIYYFNKTKPNGAWFTFRFNYDSIWNPSLPTNLISPNVMDFLIMKTMAGATAACKGNFDSLMVPYRCVASDIGTNSQVILKKGDLAESIRASMTFPLVFKPITIDGCLLFDGGIYNNFPADVMIRDFTPDYIIGSNVAANYAPPKENNIITHIENMVVTNTHYELFCENGILLTYKNMPQINLTDFSHTDQLIELGYQETIKHIDEIKATVKRRVTKSERDIKRNNFKNKMPPLIFKDIEIEGLNKSQQGYVRNYLSYKNKSRNIEELSPDYFKLSTSERIKTIHPIAKYDTTSRTYKLKLNINDEANFSTSIGGLISSSPLNAGFFELAYQDFNRYPYNLKFNTYIGRFYSSAQVSGRINFYKPLPFYIEPHLTINQWDYFKTTKVFFSDINPSYLIQSESNGGVELGIPVRNHGKLCAEGIKGFSSDKYYDSNYFSRKDVPDNSRLTFNTLGLFFERNTLNYFQYPNKGTYLLLQLNYYNAGEKNIPGTTSSNNLIINKNHNWFQFKYNYENYFFRNQRFKIGLFNEVFASNRDLLHDYTATLLSAPQFAPTPESKTLFLPNFRAFSYAAGGIKLIFTLVSNFDLRIESYIFQPYQSFNMKNDFSTDLSKAFSKRYYLNAAALVYNSPFGPVSLTLSHYDRSEDEFSLIFNIGYIIFNKKGIN